MKGGTYAEALRTGFSSEQAGFFARMSGETKDEAEERVVKALDGIIAKRIEITLIHHRMLAGSVGYVLGFISCVVLFAVVGS